MTVMTEQPPERWTKATLHDDMWVDPDDDPRDTGTSPEGELPTLMDYLSAQRLTLQMKCDGLDAEQLARRSVPPSTMSLLGLVRHLADVERNWGRRVLAGEPATPYYWRPDGDTDFDGAVADPAVVEESFAAWADETAETDRIIASFDDLGTRRPMRDGGLIAVREVVVHLVEEYARHCGHADLLRERIDGRVGQ